MPYSPSFVERIVDVVQAARIPAPLIYAGIAIVLLALEVIAKVADGTFPDEFRLIHVVLPLFAALMLPAVHGFSDAAARALDAARPLLTLGPAEVESYRYRLTTLPARGTALAASAGSSSSPSAPTGSCIASWLGKDPGCTM